MSKFTLLILCAGFGKRMLDLTTNTPKPLLKINNKTLLSNTINFYLDIGCNEIYINTHYFHEKIESYIDKNFKDYPITIIHEPSILGTGGAIKNIFNYTKSKKICVVNSDIFWVKNNKMEIKNFIQNYKKITDCQILLSKKVNFCGLKKEIGDFNISDSLVTKWQVGNEIIFYSGLQIVSKNVFKNKNKKFSMNEVWDHLVDQKKLKGSLIHSKIVHIGDKSSFNEFYNSSYLE